MKVLPTQSADAVTTELRPAAAEPSSAFKAALAQASSTEETAVPEGVKLRKGETVEKVEGHAYVEIMSGPRAGMYINTSGNSRHGEAFVLVEKADFNYHIYGSGDDRLVVRANKRDGDDDK